MVVKFTLICLIFFCFVQSNAQEFECYPSDLETMMVEYVNVIRAKPSKEILLKHLNLKTLLELKKIPPYNQEIFEQELDKIQPLKPVFYDPFLSLASRNHSKYMIANSQSHIEETGKEFFTGRRFTDRLLNINCTMPSIGENCYLKSFGLTHCMLAFLIDWGEGLGGMQTDRPHRQNIFNKSALLVGNGCIPYNGDSLSVTQIYSAGEANVDYYGGVIYTDYNDNGFYDINEGHGNVQIFGNDGELLTVSYPSGLYVLKTKKDQLKSIKFCVSDYQKEVSVINQNGNQKIDLKLNLKDEIQIHDSLQQKWLTKEITDTDFAWLCFNFQFRNQPKESNEISTEIVDLKAIKASILNELSSSTVEKLNQVISQTFKNKKGTLLQNWLKEISYVSNMKSQFFALKNLENANQNSWIELKSKINLNLYHSVEVNYYLRKLINSIDFEIHNLKDKK